MVHNIHTALLLQWCKVLSALFVWWNKVAAIIEGKFGVFFSVNIEVCGCI
jgi:hypothetical protein